MAARYRNHLILVKANPDPKSDFWNVRAHIQYNEKWNFRDVLIVGPTNCFRKQKQAEKHMIQEAKKWIDDRLNALSDTETLAVDDEL